MIDAEGNEYLDFFGGILTTRSGYKTPAVVKAIEERAAKMLHTSTTVSDPKVESRLAEKLAGLSGIPNAKVFFTNSGSEANDPALMLATGIRQSNQVLALRNSAHGRSFRRGGGDRHPLVVSDASLSPIQGDVRARRIQVPQPVRSSSRCRFHQGVRAGCRRHARRGPCRQCRLRPIAEPIQNVSGFVVPPDGFFGEMKKVLDRHGILFISDEVQTGWGLLVRAAGATRHTESSPTCSPSPRVSAAAWPSGE